MCRIGCYWVWEILKKENDPFDPNFDHSKCYYWCGNPYCDSNPNLIKYLTEEDNE